MRIEFVAQGSADVVSRAIEEYARAEGRVSAIVVPWESTRVILNMAVTSVKSDGWAIEHTNLGTITLTDLGHDATRVAIAADEPDHTDKTQLIARFDRFARQLQHHFASIP